MSTIHQQRLQSVNNEFQTCLHHINEQETKIAAAADQQVQYFTKELIFDVFPYLFTYFLFIYFVIYYLCILLLMCFHIN